jgi:hypothetical protein
MEKVIGATSYLDTYDGGEIFNVESRSPVFFGCRINSHGVPSKSRFHGREDGVSEYEIDSDKTIVGSYAIFLYKLNELLAGREYETLDISCRVTILKQLMELVAETETIRQSLIERSTTLHELKKELKVFSSIPTIEAKLTAAARDNDWKEGQGQEALCPS